MNIFKFQFFTSVATAWIFSTAPLWAKTTYEGEMGLSQAANDFVAIHVDYKQSKDSERSTIKIAIEYLAKHRSDFGFNETDALPEVEEYYPQSAPNEHSIGSKNGTVIFKNQIFQELAVIDTEIVIKVNEAAGKVVSIEGRWYSGLSIPPTTNLEYQNVVEKMVGAIVKGGPDCIGCSRKGFKVSASDAAKSKPKRLVIYVPHSNEKLARVAWESYLRVEHKPFTVYIDAVTGEIFRANYRSDDLSGEIRF